MSELDNNPSALDAPGTVAPSTDGGTPVSTPASVDTTVSPEPELDDAEKAKQAQDRKASRAFASQRRQIGELQRTIGALTERLGQPAPASETKAGPPKETDYNTFDDWLAASNEYLINQTVEKVTKSTGGKSGQDDPERANQEKGNAFWKAVAKEATDAGIKDFEDAREAIVSGEVVTSPAMSHYVIEDADNKAALVAWLAENPDESERISKLDPVRAGAALAKVDARLGKPAARTSNAPAPPPTLSGRSTPQVDLSKIKDVAEYARHRGFK